MKNCISCGEDKDEAAFGRNRAAGDGLSVYCLVCNQVKSQAYYRARREAQGFAFREPDRSPQGFKRCSRCRQELPHSEYHLHKTQSDGLATYCKDCRKAQGRLAHLKRTYGLDAPALATLVESQGGVCAVCRRRPPAHVDHDHATGRVRGVLCFNCNAALGLVQDDQQVLRNAIDYLERTGS